MFYAGPTHVTRGRLGYYFDWKICEKEVERCVASIGSSISEGGQKS
jgi:hypothetical protein